MFNIKRIFAGTTLYYSPVRLLLIIIISVFAAEAFIMLFLSLFPSISTRAWAFLDATLLILIVSPVLYVYGFRPLIMHINERKMAEEKTLSAYTELNQVFQTAADGMRLIDRNFNILRINQTFAEMTGVTENGALGKKCYEIFPGPQCHTNECSLRRVFRGETRIEFESIKERLDGRKIPCIVTATPFKGPKGEMIGIVEDFKDISEYKNAEQSLKKSEAKLNAMLQAIIDPMLMLDKELNIIWANEIARQVFGSDVTEKKCNDVFNEARLSNVPYPCLPLKAFYDGKPHEHEFRFINQKGETKYFHCIANVALRDEEGSPETVIEIFRDITESKRLEQQLLQTQKMEAIGQLAGGIAHDFNNILTAIIGYASLVQMELQKDNPLNSHVTYILNSAQRAANLTNALLAFSRKQIISPKPININDTIKSIEKLLLRLIGEDIEFSTSLTDEELTVMADPTQIEQVLMNLATNSRDAMPDGGKLLINTERVEFDSEFITAHGYGKPGTYAMISVSDTGHGMSNDIRQRIFEPFFTTKAIGKGTGLGLSMVYGIIKQHEGYINIYSEPGKGSVFKIYLPLVKTKVRESLQKDLPLLKGSSETVLIAEDDEQVRDLAKSVLSKFGYNVLEAADGDEAIRVFKEKINDIQLLILDLIMPKKNGKEVYEEIKNMKPDIKVLFTSGYTSDIVQKKGILNERVELILKPVTPHGLLKKVKEIMNS